MFSFFKNIFLPTLFVIIFSVLFSFKSVLGLNGFIEPIELNPATPDLKGVNYPTEKQLVEILCLETKWRSGAFVSALRGLEKELESLANLLNQEGIRIEQLNFLELISSIESRTGLICNSTKLEEAQRELNNLSRTIGEIKSVLNRYRQRLADQLTMRKQLLSWIGAAYLKLAFIEEMTMEFMAKELDSKYDWLKVENFKARGGVVRQLLTQKIDQLRNSFSSLGLSSLKDFKENFERLSMAIEKRFVADYEIALRRRNESDFSQAVDRAEADLKDLQTQVLIRVLETNRVVPCLSYGEEELKRVERKLKNYSSVLSSAKDEISFAYLGCRLDLDLKECNLVKNVWNRLETILAQIEFVNQQLKLFQGRCQIISSNSLKKISDTDAKLVFIQFVFGLERLNQEVRELKQSWRELMKVSETELRPKLKPDILCQKLENSNLDWQWRNVLTDLYLREERCKVGCQESQFLNCQLINKICVQSNLNQESLDRLEAMANELTSGFQESKSLCWQGEFSQLKPRLLEVIRLKQGFFELYYKVIEGR